MLLRSKRATSPEAVKASHDFGSADGFGPASRLKLRKGADFQTLTWYLEQLLFEAVATALPFACVVRNWYAP